MEPIKLVIWDLDETFWKGTLSEGQIYPIKKNIEIIETLTKRGIINSIVSKNDYDKAKDVLIELKVWDLFVFPSINWSSKGRQVKNIIEKCQLRNINVLFVDDNHLNINEVEFYNQGIHTKFPDFLNEILEHDSLKGKDDSDYSRLKQYKILEKKFDNKEKFSSNIEFLKDSSIEIQFVYKIDEYIDRIDELIQRTNQLNFTKLRINKNQTIELIKSKNYETAIIKVKDKYGDYGIVGFYCLNIKQNSLLHFIFSCRIINLGVPQYVYSKLKFPKIKIIPDVAENLDLTTPDWIIESKAISIEQKNNNNKNNYKIFFKGGCDLSQMLFYLKEYKINIEEETNYVSSENFPIHNEHTQVLLDSIELSQITKTSILDLDFLPFIDSQFYSTKLFDCQYNILVYSVLMDYTQQLYYNKKLNVRIPFGDYNNIWSQRNNHDEIIEVFNNRGINTVTKEILEKFSNEFTSIGQITPKDFKINLMKIRSLIPKNIPIIFINGAEVKINEDSSLEAFERHIKMNLALDNFIEESDNTYLLDLREIVTDETMLTDNIRHYKRKVYHILSLNLLSIIDNLRSEKSKSNSFLKINRLLKEIIFETKNKLKNFG